MNKEKINLKSKLNGNELDLSVCELTTVPSKEIAGLKKVTTLDLSRNRLSGLPDDFCIHLTNLTSLDLSSNFLTRLPEQFGQLVNLQHLDLYKNKLENLPLSFSRLERLKWLDMKDNPLAAPLQKVCGDCLDAKQCKLAANLVIAYMKQLAADHEKQQQKKLAAERALREKQQLEEEKERQQHKPEKKKDKKKDKQQASARLQSTQNSQHLSHAKNKGMHDDRTKSKAKGGRSKFSVLRILGSVISTVFIFALISVILVPHLCRTPPKSVPYSAEFCKKTYELLLLIPVNETGPFYIHLKNGIDWTQSAVDHISIRLKNFDYQTASSDFSRTVQSVASNTWTYLKIVGHLLYDLAYATAIVLSEYCIWIAQSAHHAVENWPETWEKIKFMWRNMK